jgi:hypothetical protein
MTSTARAAKKAPVKKTNATGTAAQRVPAKKPEWSQVLRLQLLIDTLKDRAIRTYLGQPGHAADIAKILTTADQALQNFTQSNFTACPEGFHGDAVMKCCPDL